MRRRERAERTGASRPQPPQATLPIERLDRRPEPAPRPARGGDLLRVAPDEVPDEPIDRAVDRRPRRVPGGARLGLDGEVELGVETERAVVQVGRADPQEPVVGERQADARIEPERRPLREEVARDRDRQHHVPDVQAHVEPRVAGDGGVQHVPDRVRLPRCRAPRIEPGARVEGPAEQQDLMLGFQDRALGQREVARIVEDDRHPARPRRAPGGVAGAQEGNGSREGRGGCDHPL
ncbi:hypothetical protein [Salinarimonas chemoclinalis]|uniref:hypothetical protein n=1 Tax=Salinarimonas chemoclinalis TaxID=3241599 RepID=UPI003556BD34